MAKYIWQQSSWPHFRWDNSKLIKPLAEARKLQGSLLGLGTLLKLKDQSEILIDEVISTSLIEGEKLDLENVRSSVAKRLGLPKAGLSKPHKNIDGLVEILISAATRYNEELEQNRFFSWHAALFPTGYSHLQKIEVGAWRKGDEPMQVISGSLNKTKIHYVAPPSKVVPTEIKKFLIWWNNPPHDLDGILRAAIAHLWFVSIHPFDDGNGRLARALTDMALAQDEKTSLRLYSLSSQIMSERKNYYQTLESTQKGDCDITDWLLWFLGIFCKAIKSSNLQIEKSLTIREFYQYLSEINLNERQKKVLNKMLEILPDHFEGGLTNKKYVSMTKTSPESAKRDIRDLLEKGILKKNEGSGRSTSYHLNKKPKSEK